MRLLMITRKIDPHDERVGFVSDWVKKLAGRVDTLIVITWQPSRTDGVPSNVEIISLSGNSFLKIIKLKLTLLRALPQVDGVFCHMNPEYTIIVAPLAKLFRKKVVSWYTHGTVSWRLRLMVKLTDVVLTASQESFRLPSKKVTVVGHGIDVDQFRPLNREPSSTLKLLTVGRISPTKDYESMIKALDILKAGGINQVQLDIVGAPGLDEHVSYLDNLKKMVVAMGLSDQITFAGALQHQEIPAQLQRADVFINLSGTGSLDKALLEAMACGCLVLTSNEAFKLLLPADLMIEQNNPQVLAAKIKWLAGLSAAARNTLGHQLRQTVVTNHNLDQLVVKIVHQFSKSDEQSSR